MIRPRILLAGAGGHARACIDVIEESGRYDVAGLTGLPSEVGSRVLGYPVLGTDRDLEALLHDCPNALVAIGQIKSVEPRERLYALLTGYDATMPVIISPRAHVSRHASIGAGTIVMHNAIVNAGATVGCNCISTASRWWSTMRRSATIATCRRRRRSTAACASARGPSSAVIPASDKA